MLGIQITILSQQPQAIETRIARGLPHLVECRTYIFNAPQIVDEKFRTVNEQYRFVVDDEVIGTLEVVAHPEGEQIAHQVSFVGYPRDSPTLVLPHDGEFHKVLETGVEECLVQSA